VLVRGHANDHVKKCIQQPGDSNHDSGGGGGHAEHIGIKEKQVQRDGLPEQAGGQITKPVNGSFS
jgi:hypothetical protein